MVKNNNPVAYCGLYCPKCYKMIVSQTAESLKDALENTHICGSANEPSKKFKSELNNLILLRCPKMCRAGGGNQNCVIRKCCLEKNIIGCWDCNSFKKCKKLTKQFICNIEKIKRIGLKKYCQN